MSPANWLEELSELLESKEPLPLLPADPAPEGTEKANHASEVTRVTPVAPENGNACTAPGKDSGKAAEPRVKTLAEARAEDRTKYQIRYMSRKGRTDPAS